MEIQFDVKAFIKLNCPNIYSIINESPAFWKKINSNFNKRAQKRDLNIKILGKYSAETIFLDLIELAYNGDKTAAAMLGLIDGIVSSLKVKLRYIFLPKVKEIVKNLLCNFDEARSNYLDSIGELLMLNFFSQNQLFEIRLIEAPLPNGKNADYRLFDQKNKNEIYVEVYNIKLVSEKSVEEESFRLFMNKRVEKKRHDKLKGLEEFDLIIAVVIWWFGDFEVLASFKDTFNFLLKDMKTQCFVLFKEFIDKDRFIFKLKNCLDL